MACGAPVIGSNTTSIPEVIGNQDALFDPNDLKSIAEKIARVLNDPGFSASLREHGMSQARNFSWEASARRALEAFESLVPEAMTDRKFYPSVNRELYNKLIGSIASIPQDKVKATERDLMETAQCIWDNQRTTDKVLRAGDLANQLHWRVEGTFHDNYSLSILTRETARALAALGHDVSLWSSSQPGFYMPTAEVLSDYFLLNPDLARMYRTRQPGQFRRDGCCLTQYLSSLCRRHAGAH